MARVFWLQGTPKRFCMFVPALSAFLNPVHRSYFFAFTFVLWKVTVKIPDIILCSNFSRNMYSKISLWLQLGAFYWHLPSMNWNNWKSVVRLQCTKINVKRTGINCIKLIVWFDKIVQKQWTILVCHLIVMLHVKCLKIPNSSTFFLKTNSLIKNRIGDRNARQCAIPLSTISQVSNWVDWTLDAFSISNTCLEWKQ